MTNVKNIVRGFLLLAFVAGAVVGTQANAETNSSSTIDGFLNAHTSLKADNLIRLENSVGVVLGSNNTLRVMGAKVTSVSGTDIHATAPFGNSSLNFVVKTDSNTQLNGKLSASATSLTHLKAGDRISFAGTITSSTSSSLVIDGDHVVSRAFVGNVESKTNFNGEVKAVNTADNSFTINLNGKTVKVNVSNSTAITLNGAASNLASLQNGDEVKITGQLNADGSVITASKISAESDDSNGDNDDDDKDHNRKDNKGKEGKNEDKDKGGFWGKVKNWFWK